MIIYLEVNCCNAIAIPTSLLTQTAHSYEGKQAQKSKREQEQSKTEEVMNSEEVSFGTVRHHMDISM